MGVAKHTHIQSPTPSEKFSMKPGKKKTNRIKADTWVPNHTGYSHMYVSIPGPLTLVTVSDIYKLQPFTCTALNQSYSLSQAFYLQLGTYSDRHIPVLLQENFVGPVFTVVLAVVHGGRSQQSLHEGLLAEARGEGHGWTAF